MAGGIAFPLTLFTVPAGRLTALLHARGTTVLAHYAYTLDAAGNRTRVTETVGGVPRGISYTYDPLYRLTAADYSTGEQYTYQYDPVGNRTTMTSTTPLSGTVVTAYTFDAAHRRTSRKDWPAKPAPVPMRYSPSRFLVIRQSLH